MQCRKMAEPFPVHIVFIIICKHTVVVMGHIINQMLAAAAVGVFADIHQLIVVPGIAAPVETGIYFYIIRFGARIAFNAKGSRQIKSTGGGFSVPLFLFADSVIAHIAGAAEKPFPAAVLFLIKQDLSPAAAGIFYEDQLSDGLLLLIFCQEPAPAVCLHRYGAFQGALPDFGGDGGFPRFLAVTFPFLFTEATPGLLLLQVTFLEVFFTFRLQVS